MGLDKLLVEELIAESFERLVPDSVSVDADGQTMQHQRQRRYAAFDVHLTSVVSEELTTVTPRDGVTTFAQEVEDFRNKTRVFEPLEAHVRDSHFLRRLIRTTCAWAAAAKFGAHATSIHANVSVHQVRQITTMGMEADNAPEGVHRDGADFIISALVIGRHNVEGGHSTVYSPDKQTVLLAHTLQAGEGLFHEDRELWHDVTKIRTQADSGVGYRDIIGLDIIMSKDGLGYGRGCAE